LTLNVFDQRKIKCPVIVDLKSNEVRSGSTAAHLAELPKGLLPGVEQTKVGESGRSVANVSSWGWFGRSQTMVRTAACSQ
jgi:hypothetical protein